MDWTFAWTSLRSSKSFSCDNRAVVTDGRPRGSESARESSISTAFAFRSTRRAMRSSPLTRWTAASDQTVRSRFRSTQICLLLSHQPHQRCITGTLIVWASAAPAVAAAQASVHRSQRQQFELPFRRNQSRWSISRRSAKTPHRKPWRPLLQSQSPIDRRALAHPFEGHRHLDRPPSWRPLPGEKQGLPFEAGVPATTDRSAVPPLPLRSAFPLKVSWTTEVLPDHLLLCPWAMPLGAAVPLHPVKHITSRGFPGNALVHRSRVRKTKAEI